MAVMMEEPTGPLFQPLADRGLFVLIRWLLHNAGSSDGRFDRQEIGKRGRPLPTTQARIRVTRALSAPPTGFEPVLPP